MKKQIEIDIAKHYEFPQNMEIVYHKDVWLAIAVETGCWIVLHNQAEFDFFNLLRYNSIELALNKYMGDLQDAQRVLIQIEARQFCSSECVPFNEQTCMIYLTNKCNLRCPHCFISAGSAKNNELSTEELFKLLNNLAVYGVKEVTFSGGEISMQPDLLKIIENAYSNGLSVKLLTNGTLWTTKMIDAIADKIISVQISIDGYSEEENSRIRGPHNFKKALTTVDRFMKKGVRTQVAITPYPDKELESKVSYFANFAKALKAKYNNSPFLKIVFTSGFMDGRDITLTPQQRKSYRDIMNIVMKEYLDEDARDYPFIIDHQQRKIMTNCSYGCLNIGSDGNVYICSRSGLNPVANVRTHTMSEIMKISKMASDLSDINNLYPCSTCHLKYICGGGCRVDEFPDMKTGPYQLGKKPERKCNTEVRNEFYDLMIRTNEQIFQ